MSKTVEDKIDSLVEVTARLVVTQEITTKNIDALTRDIKDTMCASHECDTLKSRIDKVEGKIETIEGVPTALMKRFVLVLVGASALYVASQIGMTK